MRKLIVSTAAAAAFAGSAFAADLPSVKEAPVIVAPPPAFTWTGFYVGADIGGGWGNKTIQVPATSLNPQTTINPELSGIVGGGFIGYNLQFSQFVIGVQGDFQGAGLQASAYNAVTDSTTTPNQNWLAAVNGRLGFIYDRALIYGIGGAAWTEEDHTVSAGPGVTALLNSFGIPANPQKFNWNRSGYDVGGGVEYAVAPNWTVRAEYRYYNFGNWNYNSASWVGHGHENLTDNTVTFGLSYLFGGSAGIPVLAKY